jgi:hypothetical protein
MKMGGLGKGVVASLLIMALTGSNAVLGATMDEGKGIASGYHHPSGFAEPSLKMLGTEVRKEAIKCIRAGGNFYYRGDIVCQHVTT